MPNKAKLIAQLATLQAQLETLQQENQKLRQDPAYGGLTRPALEIEHRKNPEISQYVIYVDLNKIHELNDEVGESQVDAMILQAFSFTLREGDLVFYGRWKSGDEEAFLIKGDPEGFSKRLHENLRENGLSGISAYEKIVDGDLTAAVGAASLRVKAEKRARGDSSR